MVKQGGTSYNTSQNAKKGITGAKKCSLCQRAYKQEWTLRNHYEKCRTNNIGRNRWIEQNPEKAKKLKYEKLRL